ncbi:TPM domain-containing protein [Bradyrhizobium roseum]|uniref:TPM domain-containing protein n=1 Tax=Bradyrhizobium roseum TaxID=3056648 RepID=UPI00262DCC4E|nr:YgcG family protein [Bradyrhizobium roseus]WKA29900.1 YgcG family protein [Bradyrhizobium roseus]
MKAARASLLALLMCWACSALAIVAVPTLTGRVVDQTGTLSAADIASLTQTLQDLETRKGSQIAVLIVPTTDGEAIEQFSLRVAEAWKIGRKKVDDGALLVIAKNDRRLRIEVGYGLEGALTDATTKRIIDEDITPKFKAGDFGGGVAVGVDRMVRIVNGEKLPEPEPPHWQDSQGFNPEDLFNPFLLIPAIFLGGLLRALLGRLLGSVAAGALTAMIAWFLVGSVVAAVIVGAIASFVVLISDAFTSGGPGRRGSAGGWSGGSGGSWSSGGSSGSSGGFSGGGGSFGGGGSSGSW